MYLHPDYVQKGQEYNRHSMHKLSFLPTHYMLHHSAICMDRKVFYLIGFPRKELKHYIKYPNYSPNDQLHKYQTSFLPL